MPRRPRRNGFLLLLLLALGLETADAAPASADYEIRFEADWSALTHPGAYPAGAHFSSLIGASHKFQADLWAPGELASLGIERMAEQGSTATLAAEAQLLIAAGEAAYVISGGGANSPGGTTIPSVTVSEDFPYVSLVTMIAPSPDWFTGVHGLPMVADGAWRTSITVDLYPYDAGSDDGTAFTAADVEPTPHHTIVRVFDVPLDNGTPLGRFVFTLIDATAQPDPLFANGFDPVQ
jgi:hypothetical protein